MLFEIFSAREVARFIFQFPVKSDLSLRSKRLRSRLEKAYRLAQYIEDYKMAPEDAYRDRVFIEIERIRKDIEKIDAKIDALKDGDISDMKIEIAMLQVKAGVWGLLGGLIPVGVAIIVQLLRK